MLYADGVYTHPSHSATVRGTSVPHRGTLWAASALVQGALCSACDTRMCLPHPDTGAGRAFRHVWAAGFALYLRQAHLSSLPRHEVRGGAVRAVPRACVPRHRRQGVSGAEGAQFSGFRGQHGHVSALPQTMRRGSASRCTGETHACLPSPPRLARSALQRASSSPRPATVGEEGTSSVQTTRARGSPAAQRHAEERDSAAFAL